MDLLVLLVHDRSFLPPLFCLQVMDLFVLLVRDRSFLPPLFCWHMIDLLVLLAHDGSVCFAGTSSQSVVKAGSNLVSANKSSVWRDMTASDKVRSATSLLVAMETATVAMAEELDEPATIVTRDENVGEKAGFFCLRLFVCLF